MNATTTNTRDAPLADTTTGHNTYTQRMERVEAAVVQLQKGSLDIEEAIRAFESATAELDACEAILDRAKGRFEELCVET